MKASEVKIDNIYLLKRVNGYGNTTLARFPNKIKCEYVLGKCLEIDRKTAFFEYIQFKDAPTWHNLYECVVCEVDINGKDKKLYENMWMYEI